jgi:hypothetical protein
MLKPLDIFGLLRRGGEMTAGEAEQLARELTQAKVAEMAAGSSTRSFNQPVKVVPLVDRPPAFVRGYFTQEKFVLGRTPEEMEAVLGMFGKLRRGAHVLAFVSPLKQSDFENRAYSYLPDGKEYVPDPNDRVYLPGKGAPQWVLTGGVQASCIATLALGEKFTR